MHVGSVMIFRPPREGFDYDQLVRIIEARIGAIPRFRQKVRDVPGRLGNPVWVDDEAFDMSYFKPNSDAWKDGERTFTCYLHDINGAKLTKSVKGAAAS